jgi:hypothetical protein
VWADRLCATHFSIPAPAVEGGQDTRQYCAIDIMKLPIYPD